MVRDLVAVQLPKYIPVALQCDDMRVLKTLMPLVRVFPSICKPFADKMATLARQWLMQTDISGSDVLVASQLLTLTWSCFGKSATEKTTLQSFRQLISTAHSCLDVILATVDELPFRRPDVPARFSASVVDDGNYLVSFPERLRQLEHLFTTLDVALTSTYVGPVALPASEFLDLVDRMVRFHSMCLVKEHLDMEQHRMACLLRPRLFDVAARFIVTLSTCLGHHMKRYRSVLTAILMTLLREFPTRTSTLDVARALIACLGCSLVRALHPTLLGIIQTQLDALFSRLSSDQSVMISQGAQQGGGSRKRRKTKAETFVVADQTEKTPVPSINENVLLASINCKRHFIALFIDFDTL